MYESLNITPNLSNYDDAYQLIIDMHHGLSDEESQSANAKLILTLLNHIGDISVIAEATKVVKDNTLEWRHKSETNK